MNSNPENIIRFPPKYPDKGLHSKNGSRNENTEGTPYCYFETFLEGIMMSTIKSREND